MVKPEFRILRDTGRSDGFDTIAFLHVENERQLLEELQRWMPRLTSQDALVGVNAPALDMLLRMTLKVRPGDTP